MQNHFSKQPEFQKNGKAGVQAIESREKKRKRPAHSLPNKDELEPFFTFTRRLPSKLITDKECIIQPPSPSNEPYLHQFRMLHAIDGLVKMFFVSLWFLGWLVVSASFVFFCWSVFVFV